MASFHIGTLGSIDVFLISLHILQILVILMGWERIKVIMTWPLACHYLTLLGLLLWAQKLQGFEPMFKYDLLSLAIVWLGTSPKLKKPKTNEPHWLVLEQN